MLGYRDGVHALLAALAGGTRPRRRSSRDAIHVATKTVRPYRRALRVFGNQGRDSIRAGSERIGVSECGPVETLCQQLRGVGSDMAKVQAVGGWMLDDVLSTVYRALVFVCDVLFFADHAGDLGL